MIDHYMHMKERQIKTRLIDLVTTKKNLHCHNTHLTMTSKADQWNKGIKFFMKPPLGIPGETVTQLRNSLLKHSLTGHTIQTLMI